MDRDETDEKDRRIAVPDAKEGESMAAAPNLQVVRARKSFREVYEEEFEFVWRVVRRLGLDEQAAKDATQEVFIRVHRDFAELDPSRPVRPWLGRYAWNVASEMRKRASARYERPANDALPETVDDAHSRMEGRVDAVRVITRVLDRLTDEQREVVVLHLLEDRPMPEVSRILGVKLDTCSSRLRAARKIFEPILGEHLKGRL